MMATTGNAFDDGVVSALPLSFTDSESESESASANGGNGNGDASKYTKATTPYGSHSHGNGAARPLDDDRGLDDDDDDGVEAYELQDRAGLLGGGRRYEDALAAEEGEDPDEQGLQVDEAMRRHRHRRRLSESTVASYQLYTPDEERAVVRKLDRRLVCFLALCYMLSFLDRSNIGNARIAGMEDDLQTRPVNEAWYEWALSSFYIAYIAFEGMSLLWKVVPAHIYVSMVVLSWGITASLQAVATSYPVLIFFRTLLGVGEACFTGVPFYLSFFYKRDELAFRTAMFISAAPLATTFASSLAWLILKLGENSPIAPWRLLFLIEGFPSVLVSVAAWSVIPDGPGTVSYLTARERKVAKLRLRHEKPRTRKGAGSGPGSKGPASGLKMREAFSVLADVKVWLVGAMFFFSNMAFSSLPVFLPTVLSEMGHTAVQAQALSAPPYLVAFGAVLVTAHLSDRRRSRTPFLVAHALASATGYAVLALAQKLDLGPALRYLAVYPAAVGFFNVVVLVMAWNINNQPSESRQGAGFALMQVLGQCGPLLGTRLYPDADAPYFAPGMTACAAAMVGVAALALLLRWHLARQNRSMDAAEADADADGEGEEAQGLVGGGPNGKKETGKRRFRYML